MEVTDVDMMAFRFRFRPRQVLCLVVCSMLILLCLLESQIHDRAEPHPSQLVKNAPKSLQKFEFMNAVIRRPLPTQTIVKNDSNQPTSNAKYLLALLQADVHKYLEEARIEEPEKMPRIIHLTWKNRNIPMWSKEYVRKWKTVNPGWQVWFWSDEAAVRFIRSKYPAYYDMYRSYHSNIQRADAMRYFILHEFGGFYADLDVEPIRSLEGLREKHSCVLSTEPNAHARFCFKEKDVLALLGDRVACNAIMACRQKHPFFKYVMDMLPMVKNDKNPLGSTGPMMLTYRYLAFQYFVANVIGKSPHRVLEKSIEIFLAPDDWFMPSYDEMQDEHLRRECKKAKLAPSQKEVCDMISAEGYVNGPRDSSLTNHHWVHTWIKGANKHKDPSSIDIREVLPDVIFPEEVLDF